eukprot:ANDGO_07647.mRNA.1 hypothetical protein
MCLLLPLLLVVSVLSVLLLLCNRTRRPQCPGKAGQRGPSATSGLSHLALHHHTLHKNTNTNPDTDTDTDSPSWVNLGLWSTASGAQHQQSYAQACEALALYLGAQCGLSLSTSASSTSPFVDPCGSRRRRRRENVHVWEVACGCGDSLWTWHRSFGIPWSHIHASTLSNTQHSFLLSKLSRYFSRHRLSDENDRPTVVQSDAARFYSTFESLQAQNRANGEDDEGGLNIVIALDCAYHFTPSRYDFFRASSRFFFGPSSSALSSVPSRQRLRIGLVDLVLSSPSSGCWWREWVVCAACQACSIPRCNMRTLSAYRADLQSCGFSSVHSCEQIGQHVFYGFMRFTAASCWEMLQSMKLAQAARTVPFACAALVFWTLWKTSFIDMVCIVADRTPEAKDTTA